MVMGFTIEVFGVFASEDGENFGLVSFVVDDKAMCIERVVYDCYVVLNTVDEVIVVLGVDEEN